MAASLGPSFSRDLSHITQPSLSSPNSIVLVEIASKLGKGDLSTKEIKELLNHHQLDINTPINKEESLLDRFLRNFNEISIELRGLKILFSLGARSLKKDSWITNTVTSTRSLMLIANGFPLPIDASPKLKQWNQYYITFFSEKESIDIEEKEILDFSPEKIENLIDFFYYSYQTADKIKKDKSFEQFIFKILKKNANNIRSVISLLNICMAQNESLALLDMYEKIIHNYLSNTKTRKAVFEFFIKESDFPAIIQILFSKLLAKATLVHDGSIDLDLYTKVINKLHLTTEQMQSLLKEGITNNLYHLVTALCLNGADPTEIDMSISGKSPLIGIMSKPHAKMLNALLTSISPEKWNKRPHNTLAFQILEEMVLDAITNQSLHPATWGLHELIHHGIGLQVIDEKESRTSLSLAMKKFQWDLVQEMLLHEDSQQMIRFHNEKGDFLVGMALRNSQPKVARLLIENGAFFKLKIFQEAVKIWKNDSKFDDPYVLVKNGVIKIDSRKTAEYQMLFHFLLSRGMALENLQKFGEYFFLKFELDEKMVHLMSPLATLQSLTLESLVTDKSLATFFGDAFIEGMISDKGTRLEGDSTRNSTALLIKLLEATSIKKDIRGILTNLRQSYEISSLLATFMFYAKDLEISSAIEFFTQQIQFRLKNLTVNETFLLPIGYMTRTDDGHALLLYIIKRAGKKCDCILYNSGEGIRRYHHFKAKKGKVKFVPYIEFQGIPQSTLFDYSLIQSFVELQCLAGLESFKKKQFGIDDIYSAILMRLHSYKIPVPTNPLLITGQRGGTCHMRCSLVFLQHQMGEKLYKKTKFPMQFNLLELVAGKLSIEELSQNKARLLILSEATANIARKVLKSELLESDSKVSEELIFRSKFLEKMSLKLAKAKQLNFASHPKFYYNFPESFPTSSSSLAEQIQILQKLFSSEGIIASQSYVAIPRPSLPVLPRLFDSSKEIFSDLSEITKYCLALKDLKIDSWKSIVLEYLTDTFLKLPLPSATFEVGDKEDLWSQMKSETRSECLSFLTTLSELFLEVSLDKPSIGTRRMISMHSVLACAYGIICFNEKEKSREKLTGELGKPLSTYGVDASILIFLQKNLFIHSYDFALEERLERLIDFFANSHPNPLKAKELTLFNYHAWKSSIPLEGCADYDYFSTLTISSDLKNQISKIYHEYSYNINELEFESAMLWSLAAGSLPKEYKKLRFIHFVARGTEFFGNITLSTNVLNLNSENLFSIERQSDPNGISTLRGKIFKEDSLFYDIQQFNKFEIEKKIDVDKENKGLSKLKNHLKNLNESIINNKEIDFDFYNDLSFDRELFISRVYSKYKGENFLKILDLGEQSYIIHLLFSHGFLKDALKECSYSTVKELNNLFFQGIRKNEIRLKEFESKIDKFDSSISDINALEYLGHLPYFEAAQAYLFLLHTQNRFFQCLLSMKIPIPDEVLVEHDRLLMPWITSKPPFKICLNPVIQCLTHHVVLGSFRYKNPTHISLDGLSQILTSLTLIRTLEENLNTYLSNKEKEIAVPDMESESTLVMTQYRDYIQQVMSNPKNIQPILDKLLEVLGLSGKYDWKNSYPYFIGTSLEMRDVLEIDILNGIVKLNGLYVKNFSNLYKNPLYIEFFGTKHHKIAKSSAKSSFGECYFATDENGNSLFFFLNKDSMRIEKHVGDRRYAAISWSQLPEFPKWPNFPKHPNEKNYNVWINYNKKDPTIVIIDKATQKTYAEIDAKGIFSFPNLKGKDFEWIHFDPILPVEQCLISFSEPSTIFALRERIGEKGKSPISCQYTRYVNKEGYPLGFERHLFKFKSSKGIKEVNKLACIESSGFFVSSNQKVKGIQSHQEFLVIENIKKERKLIIPIKKISHKKIEGSQVFQYEIIPLDNENFPKGNSPLQNILLAYVALSHKHYKEAFDYLKEAHCFRLYKKEELELLNWIFLIDLETNNHHPNSQAIQNLASWFIRENMRLHPKEKSWIIRTLNWKYSVEEASYAKYLGIVNNVNSKFRVDSIFSKVFLKKQSLAPISGFLSIYEECSWIADLQKDNKKLSNVLINRFNELLSLSIPLTRELVHSTIKFFIKPEILSLPSRDSLETSFEIEGFFKSNFALTRPGSLDSTKFFEENFSNLFQIACGPHKNKLRDFLLLSAEQQLDPIEAGIALILKACVDDSESFNTRSIIEEMIELERKSQHVEKREKNRINVEISRLQRSLENVLFYFMRFEQKKTRWEDVKINVEGSEKDCQLILSKLTSKIFPVLPKDPLKPSRFPLTKKSLVLDTLKLSKQYFHEVMVKTDTEKEDLYPSIDQFSEPYFQERMKEWKGEYIEGVKRNSVGFTYVFSPDKDPKKFQEFIDKSIEMDGEAIEILLGKIDKFTKISRLEPLLGVIQGLQEVGNIAYKVDLTFCRRLFIQNDLKQYQHYFSLDEVQVIELHQTILDYLLLSTEKQRLSKISAILKMVFRTKSCEKKLELMHSIGEILNQQRAYNPEEYPSLLDFEFQMNTMIRKNQSAAIKEMLSNEPVLIQMVMGGGKTLVLGTNMALLHADGYHLSLLVCLSSLFETNAEDITGRSRKIYGQEAKTFFFNRDPQYFTVSYLNDIKHLLHQTIVKRDFLILTPETLLCLKDKFLETIDSIESLKKKLKNLKSHNPVDLELPKDVTEIREQGEDSKTEFMEQIPIRGDISKESRQINTSIKELEASNTILASILGLLKERAIATLDEVDSILAPSKEFNFPVGLKTKLDEEPIRLISEIFIIASTDEAILKAGLRLSSNKQSLLSEREYKEEIRPILAEKICAVLQKNSQWADLIADEKTWGDLLAYWKGESKVPEFVFKLANSKKLVEKDLSENIVLIFKELNEWLMLSWKKTAQFHYGRSIQNTLKGIAIPYNAANTPVESAEFSGKWDMINKTLHWYIFQGLSRDQMQTWLLEMQTKANKELIAVDEDRIIYETEASRLFNEMISPLQINLFHANFSDEKLINQILHFICPPQPSQKNFAYRLKLLEEQAQKEVGKEGDIFQSKTADAFFNTHGISFKKVLDGLKTEDKMVFLYMERAFLRRRPQTVKSLLEFVVSNVFSTERTYEEQIHANPQTLCSMVKVVQGYSGTISNPHIYSDQWKKCFDKGANGQILDILLKRKQPIHSTSAVAPSIFLSEVLIKHSAASEFRAIIDVGALFKNDNNLEIARDILSFYETSSIAKIKGILYYDNKTNKLCCLKRGSSPIELSGTSPDVIKKGTGCSPDELFTFFDQRHTTGADIAQMTTSRALVTIGPHLTIRDLLQGLLRMREFIKNQNVEIVFPKEIISVIENMIKKEKLSLSSLNLSEIILFAMIQEIQAEQNENLQSTIQMIGEMARDYCLEKMIKDPKVTGSSYDLLRPIFVRSMKENLVDLYAKEMKPIDVGLFLSGYQERLLGPIKLVFSADKKGVDKLTSNITKLIAKALEKEICKSKIDIISKDKLIQEGIVEIILSESVIEKASTKLVEERVDLQSQLENFKDSREFSSKPATEKMWPQGCLQAISVNDILKVKKFHFPSELETKISLWTLQDVFQNERELSCFKNLFDSEILLSENFVFTTCNEINLCSRYKKSVNEVLVLYDKQLKDRNPWKIVILDSVDAVALKKMLKIDRKKISVPMGLLTAEGLPIVLCNLEERFLDTQIDLKKLLIQALFLGGNLSALKTKNLLPVFKDWAKIQTKQKQLFFENSILDPFGKSLYKNSIIELILSADEKLSFENEITLCSALLKYDQNIEFNIMLKKIESNPERYSEVYWISYVDFVCSRLIIPTLEEQAERELVKCLKLLKKFSKKNEKIFFYLNVVKELLAGGNNFDPNLWDNIFSYYLSYLESKSKDKSIAEVELNEISFMVTDLLNYTSDTEIEDEDLLYLLENTLKLMWTIHKEIGTLDYEVKCWAKILTDSSKNLSSQYGKILKKIFNEEDFSKDKEFTDCFIPVFKEF